MAQSLIDNIKKNYPDLLKDKHLVKLGLYSKQEAIYRARRDGTSPDYLKVGRKIFYQKSVLIDFIEKNSRDGSIPANQQMLPNRQSKISKEVIQ